MTTQFQKGDYVVFRPTVTALALEDAADVDRNDAKRLLAQKHLYVKALSVADDGITYAILSEQTTWGYAMFAVPTSLLQLENAAPSAYSRIAAVVFALFIVFALAALYGYYF